MDINININRNEPVNPTDVVIGTGVGAFRGSDIGINPLTMGAKGDGKTDDTDAFQKAFDDAIAKGVNHVHVSKGTYLLSGTGRVYYNTWAKTNRNYGVLVSGVDGFLLTFDAGAEIVIAMEAPDVPNIFVFSECSNVVVRNARGRGLNQMLTRRLYAGALIACHNCNKVTIENPVDVDLGHCVAVFQCHETFVVNGWSERTDNGRTKADTVGNLVPDPRPKNACFGSYAAQNTTFKNCTAYGGCDDGDISVFGGGSRYCIVDGCRIFNYFYKDINNTANPKPSVKSTAQGICIDSGCHSCTVVNCLVYGYYYGIDVKTDVEFISVLNNTVQNCMVGITSRLGEGNLPLAATKIIGNQICPNGGNSRTKLVFSTPFDLDGKGIATVPTGIWVQNTQNVVIENNTIGNDYFINDSSANWLGIYLSMTKAFVEYDFSYIGSIQINGNTFWQENRQHNSGKFGGSHRECIYIVRPSDTESYIPNVSIINNLFGLYYGADFTNNIVNLDGVTNAIISNNRFNDLLSNNETTRTAGRADADGDQEKYWFIRIRDAVQVNINSNQFGYNWGVVKFQNCRGVMVNNNTMREGQLQLNKPYLSFVDCEGCQVTGNQTLKLHPVSLADGKFIGASGTSTGFLVVGNNLEFANSWTETSFWSGFENDGTENIVANNRVKVYTPETEE